MGGESGSATPRCDSAILRSLNKAKKECGLYVFLHKMFLNFDCHTLIKFFFQKQTKIWFQISFLDRERTSQWGITYFYYDKRVK